MSVQSQSGPEGVDRPGRAAAPSQARRDATPNWVVRLFSARGVLPPPKRLFWYGHHLQKFLRWCRNQPGYGNLADLRAGYLREVESSEATTPTWQLNQVRAALDAFEQDVENRHWKQDELGVWTRR